MFLERSEILNFCMCYLEDQNFRIFDCVRGGIEKSEFFPVLLGGSEIRNFVLCYFKGSEILNVSVCSWGNQKF